ncbi:MAG: tRNA 4-thiouridine(8) synthase ThiI [Planctomycetota bacterium]|nr:tRNA 4-thiouridine(8) synthase ThiI [Planctomycetota bacterium]
MTTTLAAPEAILVRYAEIALKKGNRPVFERALARNLREAAKELSPVRVERTFGRITVYPERRALQVARRLADVPGVKTVSPVWGAQSDPTDIARVAKALLDDTLAEHPGPWPIRFRIRARRAEKRFPMTSGELEHALGPQILPGPDKIKVDLENADLTLGIEVRSDRTWLYLRSHQGPGGLPVGTLGRGLVLLSGGIDSPVAAYLAMKRGCRVGYISFHSSPFIGEGFVKKVTDLARALGRYQSESRLFIVPFAEVQTSIRDNAPEPYRTVLYRRFMQRIADRVADEHDYQALVTGEALGQVASQTMENMECIGAATQRMVLRPLLTYDKEEAVTLARKIGTFELSNVPEPDCCTVFQPSRPVIKGTIKACLEAEAKLDVAGLVDRAVAGLELRKITFED